MPRYFFVQPDVTRPVGGNNVSLQLVNLLREAGYEAAALNAASDYVYPFFKSTQLPYYYPPLSKVTYQFLGRRARLKAHLKGLLSRRETGPNPLLTLRPSDVLLLPEYLYPEYSALFPQNRKILFVQDVYGFCFALQRDLKNGTNALDDFEATITTSAAAQSAVAQFTGLDSFLVSQSVTRPGLDSKASKKRQIAYMPRKRPKEITTLLGCLRENPALEGWNFRKIENVSPEELDNIFNESLIFLSFSYREGFGLPPAEAMAAGCLVVGYTGVGGEEYFQPDTGFPVLDSDIVGFAKALEGIVTEYDSDPARLDQLRANAAKTISDRYSPDTMRSTLLSAWQQIDARLST
ncbi:glycosyltransferase [Ruegeria sp. ANG-R]|uniref:glycosyltransferase family protein n=1 Tax=Ruegeria sp. ANG-R TaxID=1577903 RepID=UPI00068DBE69|nr:glycosyltransferase [Ruegeria sp. ANG-R]